MTPLPLTFDVNDFTFRDIVLTFVLMLTLPVPTIRAASLNGLGALARRLKVDEVKLMRQVGLNPKQLTDTETRISLKAACQLLDALAKESGRDDIGLQMADQRRVSNLGVLGLLMALQPDLRSALHMFVARRREACSGLAMSLEEREGIAVLAYDLHVPGAEPGRQAVEQCAGVLVQLFRLFLGKDWTPRRVCFRHPPPGDMSSHRRLLGWSVEFEHDFNALVLTSQELDTPAPLQDTQLADLAQKHLPRTVQTERISETCRATLSTLLPQGQTSIDEVALRLGLQRRTLQRRLDTEGVTYSQVLQALREDLYNEYRTHRQYSLATVAAQLGFSSASAFSRWHRATFGRAARSG